MNYTFTEDETIMPETKFNGRGWILTGDDDLYLLYHTSKHFPGYCVESRPIYKEDLKSDSVWDSVVCLRCGAVATEELIGFVKILIVAKDI